MSYLSSPEIAAAMAQAENPLNRPRMLKHEILAAKGRLADLREQRETARLKAQAEMIACRSCLDIYQDNIEDVNAGHALTHATDFAATVARIRELNAQIQRIEKDLG